MKEKKNEMKEEKFQRRHKTCKNARKRKKGNGREKLRKEGKDK